MEQEHYQSSSNISATGFSSVEPFPTKLGMSLSLPAVLSATILFAVAIYKKVEIEHPVFAVVFQVGDRKKKHCSNLKGKLSMFMLQELVSFVAVEATCLLLLLFLMADHFL